MHDQTSYDHILVIGFGGPEKPSDILPFLRIVTEGRNIPEERLKSVAHHYEAIGGKSPYNPITLKLVELLKEKLISEGIRLPVYLGLRNWNPFLKDTLSKIKADGLKRGIGIILAPFRSEASCQRYKKNVQNAAAEANALDIHYDFLESWFDHPGFIQAQADQVKILLEKMPSEEKKNLLVLFSNHSIPIEMDEGCPHCRYSREFEAASSLVAGVLGLKDWQLVYQSRSGNPRTPWLEPDVSEVIGQNAEKKKAVLLIPIGFLCDNAEVLYDLDIEAKAKAVESGIHYYRASTVTHHEKFVGMFCELILEKLQRGKSVEAVPKTKMAGCSPA